MPTHTREITSTALIYFSDMRSYVRDNNLYKWITDHPFYYYLASVSLVLVEITEWNRTHKKSISKRGQSQCEFEDFYAFNPFAELLTVTKG